MSSISLRDPGPSLFPGIAVSPDGYYMVVSQNRAALIVYSLPDGEHIRTIGSVGAVAQTCAVEAKIDRPAKLCFSAVGTILVAQVRLRRVQEVTITGEHVRFFGDGLIPQRIVGIAANTEFVVVGKCRGVGNDQIMMFDAVTGVLLRSFGECGTAPGQLGRWCQGFRITMTPDSSTQLFVASDSGSGYSHVSVFTANGKFVSAFGDQLFGAAHDVDILDSGDLIVCDHWRHRMFVFSPDGTKVLQEIALDGDPRCGGSRPTALAVSGGRLYVLERETRRVQVFV